MKYLFLNLEHAISEEGNIKICEFGYVLTNEKFEILKKGNFIIDPYINKSDLDWRVEEKILTRKVKEYELPRFDKYYFDIKDLINSADYVIGHSLDGDAKALNDECQRYELDSIDFDFYDIKKLYMEYKNTKAEISVNNIMKSFNSQCDEKAHDAEADAYITMLFLKAMLDSLELSLEDLIKLCPNAKDRCENFKVSSLEASIDNKKEVVVNSQFLDVIMNKNRKQNKDVNIIIRIEPMLKDKFMKKCKKKNKKISEVIVAFINEYVEQE